MAEKITLRWRVGRSFRHMIYLDDQLVGLMDTTALAAQVVASLGDTDTLRLARFLADLAVEDPGEISVATADLLSFLTRRPVEPYNPGAGEKD